MSNDLTDLDDLLGDFDDGPTPAAGPLEAARPAAAARPIPRRATEALSDLWTPGDEPENAPVADLAQVLLDNGSCTAAILSQAQAVISKTPGKKLADVLVEMSVAEQDVQSAVAIVRGLGFERVSEDTIDEKMMQRLGRDYCKERGVVPLRMSGSRLLLGVVHPDNLMAIDEVRHRLGVAVKPVVVCRKDIVAIVDASREEEGSNDNSLNVDEIIAGVEEDDVEVVNTKEEEVDLEKMAGESPVIRLVNFVIADAVKQGASDIHIEPQEKKLKIRYRIDGILFEAMSPPHQMHAAIISRLKVMSNLDISERRLPQDGRIRAVIHGRKLDLRLSTLPTVAGEKAVMRILDTRSIQVSLDHLGMGEDTLNIWKHQIDQPHGIILVTGPTGSGKTTTLYASLAQLDRNELNISTVEDPVEYHLNGINQVQAHEKIGMSFAAALRSLLRQDPDVVMVGEIRDAETAKIAIQASLTGHLVLSTLHTNDAPSSVTRLINIGVEPYLIGAALHGCLAQRLTRRICEHCKVPTTVDGESEEHLAMLGIHVNELFKGEGCDRCRNTGYSGRVGLYELLVLDDFLRDKVVSNPNVTEFRRICVERGMVTLRIDGFKKVALGMTTVDEVLRVTEATI
ncbi:MAG: GspE/PulE family protein [Phycisphaeraceae bacterium]